MKIQMAVMFVIASFFFGACQGTASSPSAPAAVQVQVEPTAPVKPVEVSPKPQVSGSEVVAVVNGVNITDDQVQSMVAGRIKKIESEIYEIKMSGLKSLMDDLLLKQEAEKRQIDVKQLLDEEVVKKAKDPTEAEIKAEYEANKARRYRGQTLDQAKPRILSGLKLVKQRELRADLVKGLRDKADIEIKMDVPRAVVSVDDDPAQGPEGAKVTLIEFSDFQCPFCKRARATVSKILETYPQDVRYVFRDFPLSFHDKAFKASEAAQCAGDQGKYWEYNSKLWDNQGAIDGDSLKKYAVDLKLDTKKFNTCLDGGQFEAEVSKDLAEGQEAGVSGTPAYFINGIPLSGARPFEDFKEIIEGELARR